MPGDDRWDDEIWDEERWEAFLRESDRRTDRYMELMYGFLKRHPRPDARDADALAQWKATLRRFLRDKGWQREDIILPFLWLEEEEPDDDWAGFEAPAGDGLADDAWTPDPVDDILHVPVYGQASALATDVLDWAHGLAVGAKDSTLVQYCACATQITAYIARGHGFGFERDALGGNIACAKRALAVANAALALLREMRHAPYMDASQYRRLYEQTYEVRNALGLYVQELRERFDLGID